MHACRLTCAYKKYWLNLCVRSKYYRIIDLWLTAMLKNIFERKKVQVYGHKIFEKLTPMVHFDKKHTITLLKILFACIDLLVLLISEHKLNMTSHWAFLIWFTLRILGPFSGCRFFISIATTRPTGLLTIPKIVEP